MYNFRHLTNRHSLPLLKIGLCTNFISITLYLTFPGKSQMKGREKLPKVHSKSYYHGIDYYFMNVSISLKYQLKTFTLKNIPNNYFFTVKKKSHCRCNGIFSMDYLAFFTGNSSNSQVGITFQCYALHALGEFDI